VHKNLVGLIKRWRDIERRSWRVLINTEINKIRIADLPIFVKLKHLIFYQLTQDSYHESKKDKVSKIFGLMDEYIRMSNFATYELRLNL
jgi:hypothetical protein